METHLNLSQQQKLFDAAIAKPVTLIGAGAVGSHVAVALAKLGVSRITVYDGDYVESHNLPMSVYRLRDLARPKVEALREIIEEATGVRIEALVKPYEGEPLRDAVICCVDTMEARTLVWKAVEMRPETEILIDTRTCAELVWVFAVNPCDPDDIDYYRHHVAYSSREAAPQTCGKHGIAFVSMRAAAAACANLTHWWQYGRKRLHHKELVGELEVID